jgi:hypothetical protein
MRKLGWFALQIAVIGFFVWVDWGVSHSDDTRAMPGLLSGLGVLLAFVATALGTHMLDSRRRSLPIARTPRAPALPNDVAESIEHRDELSAPGRSGGELAKPVGRLR